MKILVQLRFLLPALFICLVILFWNTTLAVEAWEYEEIPVSSVDFSGVELFLELTALLEQDKEPTFEQWDKLFATPGYAVLLKREFRKDFFMERFTLAFMPSKRAELEAQMKKDTGFWAQFLPHYLRAKAMRRDIERQIVALRAMNIYPKAIRRAQSLLPKAHFSEAPSVAFVIFAPDARGYDPIVIDILYSLDQKDRFQDSLAHEFHHWYRNRLVDIFQDQDALWVINQVHAEGLADLIDKSGWPRKPAQSLSPWEKDFMNFYAKSPAIIRSMDEILTQMGQMRIGHGELGARLREIVPMSGHPTGFYMAGIILEELGKDTLVETVANPFAFFRLFNDAAKKKGQDTPFFSERAIEFLRYLEKRYLN